MKDSWRSLWRVLAHYGVLLAVVFFLAYSISSGIREGDSARRAVWSRSSAVVDTEFLLADEHCFRRLLQKKPCYSPLTLASPRSPDKNHALLERGIISLIDYSDDNATDYLLFHTVKEDRAVIRYNLTKRKIPVANGMTVLAYVPDSVSSFLWHWERGRFMKCNPRLTRPQNEPRNIPLSFVNRVAEFRDLCASYGITCFLFCGSLLGWFRECSVIPHTPDFDMAAFRGEHSEQFTDAVRESQQFPIFWVLGRLNDSREITMTVAGVKTDLFYVYQDPTRDAEYIPSMDVGKKQALRFYHPKIQGICAGDLLNRLMFVPCNTEDILKASYGDRWYEDLPSRRYDWLRSPKNTEFRETYSSSEWTDVYVTGKAFG